MGNIYTVSQVNRYIKNMFEGDLFLRSVEIKGEISNCKYHPSGHIYFTLKEEGSSIAAVMFRSARATGLDFQLENGQSVVVKGSVSAYERDGKYQIYAKEIKLDGRGDLYQAYEVLKQRLYEEGLFDFEHKKEIPKFPKKVGIVTASTGAAIRDIQNVAHRRNPYVQLYLYPAKVQGDGAAATIVKGIEVLDTMGMDTIIIGRGGGSIEDLWPFNEECVARAIYAANTPIISGTGHEIDNTIADYAADLRAPTPSAACEVAIPDIMMHKERVRQDENRLRQLLNNQLKRDYLRLQNYETKLDAISPMSRLQNQNIYLDSLTDRMLAAFERKFTDRRNQYEKMAEHIPGAFAQRYRDRRHQFDLLLTRLDGLSPTAKLTKGYGYVERMDGVAVASIDSVKVHDEVAITIHDGTIHTIVTNTSKKSEE